MEMVNKKGYYIVIGIMVCAIVIVLTWFGVCYIFSVDTNSDDLYKIIQQYGENSGQSKELDDYTVTLEKYIFDEKAELVYCQFRVSGERKVIATILKDDRLNIGFGENHRFYFGIESDTGGTGEFYAKYEGDDLIIYGNITYHNAMLEDECTIKLYDIMKESIPESNNSSEAYVAQYNIENNVNCLEFFNGKTNVYVSPFSIKTVIESTKTIETKELTICYKDGIKKRLIKNGKWSGIESKSSSNTEMQYTETFLFSIPIDMDEIEYIIYNGEKLE